MRRRGKGGKSQIEKGTIDRKRDKNKPKSILIKAIEKGNMDGARIHAENAIRQKNQVRRR